MDNALLLSLSNQMVARRSMDVIANNIANMNTTGCLLYTSRCV